MDNVIDIFEALESDNSRLFKEDLLRKNRDNTLLKRVFVSVGDPYKNYYVNKVKTQKPLLQSTVSDNGAVMAFLDLLENSLANRKITGNAAKSAVENFLSGLDSRQIKWCTRILLRNLRVGVMETTINKTWPGSISKFSVQLAESLKSHFEKNKGIVVDDEVNYPVRVEPKLDGLRCVAVKCNGEVTMFTRNGTVLETLPKIKAALESAEWDNFVLDGEALGEDWNESASVIMSHKYGKDDSNIKYHVFDAMHFDDWKNQENESTLRERVDLIADLLSQISPGAPICQVDGQEVDNEQGLLKFYASCMDKGYEGIMVKDPDASYCFKRSESVLKLKPVSTYEGVVVGHYEGGRGTRREGMWGGFEVLMPNGIVTRVGGGFTDKIKAEIGINPDAWLGKILEVEGQPDPLTANGLTKDGKVRFPVFVRERDASDVDSKVMEAYDVYCKKNSAI